MYYNYSQFYFDDIKNLLSLTNSLMTNICQMYLFTRSNNFFNSSFSNTHKINYKNYNIGSFFTILSLLFIFLLILFLEYIFLFKKKLQDR